jgi:hypothetical protein
VHHSGGNSLTLTLKPNPNLTPEPNPNPNTGQQVHHSGGNSSSFGIAGAPATNSTEGPFDRVRELLGYDCRLINGGEESEHDQKSLQLVICPKTHQGEGGDTRNSNMSSMREHVLRIVPLQMVRVAITAAPLSENTNAPSKLRLTLISPIGIGGSDKDKNEGKKKNHNRSSDFIFDAVVEDSREKSVQSDAKSSGVKNSHKDSDVSLYHSIKEALLQSRREREGDKNRLTKSRSKLVLAVRDTRYEISGASRLAFGPEDSIRRIYISSRNKEIDKSKVKEREREIRGESMVKTSSPKREKVIESEDLFTSITGGMLAKAKMESYGEEWAEEEELPTSWEAGEGGGADTQLGSKGQS